MKINDVGNQGFKSFRDETAEVKDDRKAIMHGFKIIDQSENDSYYEYLDGGGEAGWGYWRKIEIGQELTPLEPDAHSRIFAPYPYMRDDEQGNTEEREEGVWGQAIPCVMNKDGLQAIENSNKTNKLITKTITTMPTGETNDEVRPINGYVPANGVSGVIVTSAAQDKEHQYFVQAGGLIEIDHDFGGKSTKALKVQEDGYIDPDVAAMDSIFDIAKNEANIPNVALNLAQSGKDNAGYGMIVTKEGESKIVSFLSSEKGGPITGGGINDKHKIGNNSDNQAVNPAHISTDALFFMDAGRDGALQFESYYSPAITPPAEPEYYLPAYCVYNVASGKWRWVVPMTTGEEIKIIARIAWQFENGEDRSEAQAVTWINGNYNTIEGVVYWIDYNKSMGTTFSTAGDNTIFMLTLIEKEVVRGGVTRDLYRATHCVYDMGHEISHIEKKTALGEYLYAYMASDGLSDTWDETRRIKTTIGATAKENIINANVAKEWVLTDEGINKWMELMTWCEGLQSYYRPIRPALVDIDLPYDYKSLEKIGENPISTYRKRSE